MAGKYPVKVSLKDFVGDNEGLQRSEDIAVARSDGLFDGRFITVEARWDDIDDHSKLLERCDWSYSRSG
jgi:hypothetical protein